MKSALNELSDEELIAERIRNGGEVIEILCERYLRKISILCRKFCSANDSHYDDLLQEGFIALFSAIDSYNPDRGASFFTFASSCVRNRLINCIQGSAGTEHSLVGETSIAELNLPDCVPSPEHLFIEKETDESYLKNLRSVLSDMELAVLTKRLDNYSYADIASSLSLTEKSVENALSRVRMKLRPHI